MKATILVAAALLAGCTSLAMAQAGGAGGEPARGSDANPPSAAKQQPGETKNPNMNTAPTGMNPGSTSGSSQGPANSETRKQGPETGTAKDQSSAPAR